MKVLVVESDDLSSRILAKKLGNWGHDALIARSVADAQRLIDRESFRLIITEIELPDRSGTELVRHVRAMKRPRYTYITILTAVTETNRLLEALEAGADDLLRKPLNVFEMRLRIKAAKRMLNMEDELREGGGTDSTTGLVNHASFRQFFRVIVSENRRTKATGALMFLRLDNYTDMRDSSGHQAAEHVMRVVAQALAEIVRSADLVVRLSDDCFGLCLQNTDWPTCRIVGEKALGRLRGTQLVYEGHDLRPRVTIESLNFPDGDRTADELLQSAPRFPFAGGDPAPPAAADPLAGRSAEPTQSEMPAPPSPQADAGPTAELLARAGIDAALFNRLSEPEQRQVLKLAERLDDAANQEADPA